MLRNFVIGTYHGQKTSGNPYTERDTSISSKNVAVKKLANAKFENHIPHSN